MTSGRCWTPSSAPSSPTPPRWSCADDQQGVEALLLVSEQKPHGMLIDLNMPDIDGLEVCRRIRARKQMERVRLITMTSNHSPEVVEQSKQAGAIACLAKPLDVQQVLELFRIPLALGTKK